ncbi:hypothetical protein AMK27_38405 [Streptomyces sp. CB02009]|uniref:hypothetical protein n=1 Tax=Streptomyces sp. CB02009 TaxID=1703938 RepID=UPI00093B1315|nr:hypothetical protein [Streptomyces sp. CB02009]OKJ48641.1 hypothetical protein AMK27_38405 [Streptomyces sp. CB02009]
MTIQIAPLAVMILVVAAIVGLTVFKYTARAYGIAGRGDLAAAIASGVGVAAALAVLLAPGFGHAPGVPAAPPASTAERVSLQ